VREGLDLRILDYAVKTASVFFDVTDSPRFAEAVRETYEKEVRHLTGWHEHPVLPDAPEQATIERHRHPAEHDLTGHTHPGFGPSREVEIARPGSDQQTRAQAPQSQE
jgi:hypothetical protein